MNSDREVLVKTIVHGGYGLSDISGKKALVKYALPSELVRVKIIREKKDYIEAVVDQVLSPSIYRRPAPCRYYGYCGGCQLQHTSYTAQINAKLGILKDNLERIGKLRDLEVLEAIPSQKEFNYRIRAQFKVSHSKLGFFSWKSYEIVDIDECLLMHPAINQIIPALKELSKKLTPLKEIHLTYSPTEEEILIKLIVSNRVDKDKLRKYYESFLPKNVVGIGLYNMVGKEYNKVYTLGREFTYIKIRDFTYRLSLDSFFQVNHTLWDRLVDEVTKEHYRRAIELHCGAGFFSLPLSKMVEYLIAGDVNSWAIKDAIYSAKLNNVGNVAFYKATSIELIKKHAGEIFDLLVLDPPRSGLSEGEAKLIIQNKPHDILYISCNPSTLARDLKVLTKGGYKVEYVKLLDNFPQTYHVESITKLTLRAS